MKSLGYKANPNFSFVVALGTRFLTRFKKRVVSFIEATATEIDPTGKTVSIVDDSEITPMNPIHKVSYDYLVIACGAENATFGIPGVREHGCFLKEIRQVHKR